MATRRGFLVGAGAVAALAATRKTAMANGLITQNSQNGSTLEQRLADDPMRPQFHLLPAKNWMNDPNGPIYFNGNYHMFFQYNPQGATWGDMSWNHATSKDMLHWTHLPVAFEPTPDGPDAFGCFSGSAIAMGERVYVVYTGTKKSGSDLATIRDGANNIQESQCLAWSDDPKLVLWTKDPQPIVPRPPAGLNITGFRDPSAWKQGEWYYMTVGSGISDVGGCVLLYRSKDLKNWTYLHKLTSGEWNGKKTANPCDDGEMWECPEFFALDGGHVLIYSTLGKVFWQSGQFDEATMKFHPQKTGLLDLDAFYAPKTQLDANGRRILWGWIPERRSEAAMRNAGWSGMMSLPRVMNLDADGTLRVKILEKTSSLRAGELSVQDTQAGALAIVPHAKGEVLCTGANGSDMEFSMHADNAEELLHVKYFAATHSFMVEGKQIVLEPADAPKLHAFVDGSVIELILSERIGYTKRFYYSNATAPDIKVRTTRISKAAMHAWNISPISNDRLTKPAL